MSIHHLCDLKPRTYCSSHVPGRAGGHVGRAKPRQYYHTTLVHIKSYIS